MLPQVTAKALKFLCILRAIDMYIYHIYHKILKEKKSTEDKIHTKVYCILTINE